MKLYTYNKNDGLDFNIEKVGKSQPKKNEPQKIVLTYDSPYKTGVKENDKVHCELFLNIDCSSNYNFNQTRTKISDNTQLPTNSPLLILIHGFNSKKSKLHNYYNFINKIVENNILCAFINLPFHIYRTPKGESSGQRLIYYDDMQTLEFFHQSVIDVRKFIDIIYSILPIKKIYISGISLGSMVSLITMANDSRIDKGIFLISGGNWEEIHWNGLLKFILRGNCNHEDKITREKCREFYLKFPDFLKKFKQVSPDIITTDLENYPEIKKLISKKCFLCDPLAFAHKINPKNVLMINVKFDHYFSKNSTLQLWEELGKPEISWFNYFHSSKILTDKKVIKKILNFISEN